MNFTMSMKGLVDLASENTKFYVVRVIRQKAISCGRALFVQGKGLGILNLSIIRSCRERLEAIQGATVKQNFVFMSMQKVIGGMFPCSE